MRDLMEITARPEVISLAGGLPDTSTFPPESFAAQMTRIAQESSAEALQYGPTEGFAETKECIREVMRAEGMDPDPDDVIVTTGGQQAIDLVAKTLVDPGDVVIAEAPTYPGAVPVFCSYQAETLQVEMDAEGMRVDLLEQLLDRLAAEGRRPKFIYSVPSFQNPAGVTMSAERRRRLVEIARERELLVVEDNPYGLLRYEGEPLEPALQARRRRLRALPRHALEDPLAGDPARLAVRAAAGDGEGRARQAGRRPLHLDPDPVLRPRVLRRGPLARLRRRPAAGSTAARRDAMLEALERFFPAQATWSRPEGGLFCWATLPDYIDTTDLLARRRCARTSPSSPAPPPTPTGAAARRCGSTSPPPAEDEIREGVRRIGAVIAEQVELFETITGEYDCRSPSRRDAQPAAGRTSRGRRPPLPAPRQ